MIPPSDHEPSEPPAYAPVHKAPRRPTMRFALAGLMVVVLAALAGGAIARSIWPSNSSSSNGSSSKSSSSNSSSSRAATLAPSSSSGSSSKKAVSGGTTAAVAAHVTPGVVDINTTLAAGQGEAAGTGMVVSSNGEVITNNHVISSAVKITVRDIGNGKTYTARVVGYDRAHDIAVLQLENASGLQTVPLGNSTTVSVGAAVVTIGNAGGVGGAPSVAGGSVSAINRSITASDSNGSSSERLTGLIQIDGNLQAGDSGGPLVNSAGQVIGMDTAASSGFSFQSSSAGTGFAIPINTVLRIANKILAGNSSGGIHIGASAELGVLISSGATAQGGANGFYFGGGYGPQQPGGSSTSNTQGAYVAQVNSGTPAAAAGIAAGDTITALGGHAVKSETGLITLMARHHPGDRVSVTWVDGNGATHHATVRLVVGPAG